MTLCGIRVTSLRRFDQRLPGPWVILPCSATSARSSSEPPVQPTIGLPRNRVEFGERRSANRFPRVGYSPSDSFQEIEMAKSKESLPAVSRATAMAAKQFE